MDRLLDLLRGNLRAIGILAVVVCAVTWWMDLSGMVHECIYCRTQRTAIGAAGLLLLFPDPRQWWIRWPMAAVCFLGADVAVDQIFLVIRNLSGGRESNPMNLILATGSLFVLTGIALLVFTKQPRNGPQSDG